MNSPYICLAVSDAQLLMYCGIGLVALWATFRVAKLVAKVLFKVVFALLVVAAVLWVIWIVGQ